MEFFNTSSGIVTVIIGFVGSILGLFTYLKIRQTRSLIEKEQEKDLRQTEGLKNIDDIEEKQEDIIITIVEDDEEAKEIKNDIDSIIEVAKKKIKLKGINNISDDIEENWNNM